MQLTSSCALFHVSLLICSMCCRLAAVKKAADAAGRRLCFVGMSLNTYLEAAHKEGMAPFDPKELIPVGELDNHDPNKVMVITTGSQVPIPRCLFFYLFVCFLSLYNKDHMALIDPEELISVGELANRSLNKVKGITTGSQVM